MMSPVQLAARSMLLTIRDVEESIDFLHSGFDRSLQQYAETLSPEERDEINLAVRESYHRLGEFMQRFDDTELCRDDYLQALAERKRFRVLDRDEFDDLAGLGNEDL